MTEPTFSSYTFHKQVNRWLRPGACFAVRALTKPGHFIVLSRESVSDMAAVSAINELLRREADPLGEDEMRWRTEYQNRFPDDSHHMGPDE